MSRLYERLAESLMCMTNRDGNKRRSLDKIQAMGCRMGNRIIMGHLYLVYLRI